MDAHNNPDRLPPDEAAAEEFGGGVGIIVFLVTWAACLQFGLMGLFLGWIPGLCVGGLAGFFAAILRLYWWQIPLLILVVWVLIAWENQNMQQSRIPAAQSAPSQPPHVGR